MSQRFTSLGVVAAATTLCGVATSANAAQILTWDGLTNSSTVPADKAFTTVGNWVGDPVVATNDATTEITLGAAASGGQTYASAVTGVGAGNFFDLLKLSITQGGTVGSSAGRLRFADGGTLTYGGASNTTVQYAQVNDSLTINGTNTASNTFFQEAAGSGTIFKSGTGLINWDKNGSFNGTLVLESGTVVFAGADWNPSTGSRTFRVEGGDIQARASNFGPGGNVTVQLNGDFRFTGSQANQISGSSITLGGSGSARTITVASNVTSSIGAMSGVGKGLTVQRTSGSGTVRLAGTNTFNGATTVTSGVLGLDSGGSVNSSSGIAVNGGTFDNDSSTAVSIPVAVAVAATLDGTGTGGFSNSVTLDGSATYSGGNFSGTLAGTGAFTGATNASVTGILAPGNGSDATGSLAVGGALTLSSTSTYQVGLAGTAFTLNATEEYDRVKVSGLATLAGALNVSIGSFDLVDDQLFGILDVGSLSGAFSNFAEGAIVAQDASHYLRVTYLGEVTDTTVAKTGGDDVVLYTAPVPEPTSLSLLALGGLGLLRRRRS